MTSSLTDLRPPPTLPPIASLHARKRPSTAGYWVAAVVAVLGLMAAFLWGAVGFSTTLDRVDGLDRTAVPGQVTVSVTDAYGSIFFLLAGFVVMVAVAALIVVALTLYWAVRGQYSARRHANVANVARFWAAMVVMWVVGFGTLYLGPHLT